MTENEYGIWTIKGATLSDKSARKEYNLTQFEIYNAMKEGKLQFREISIYGNPCFRLIRTEVEKLVAEKHGKNHLKIVKLENELKNIESELRKLKIQAKKLDNRKIEIQEILIKHEK